MKACFVQRNAVALVLELSAAVVDTVLKRKCASILPSPARCSQPSFTRIVPEELKEILSGLR